MRTKQKNMKISKESRIRTISPAMAGIFGVLGFVGLNLSSINAFAEVFEAEQGLSFTLNSSVAVSITGGTGSGSDGLTIDDLVPGDYKDSNIITVTASSNSVSGYTLSSSVGSSSSNYTDLRKTPSDSTNKFTNLSGNKVSLSNFDPGTWGYSYSTNGGTSWISGDIVSGTSAGYNGLPIYTTSTPIKLINSSSASSSSIQFKIGAKATSSQVSGAYTNIINFIGVGKVITTTYTINYNTNGGSTIAAQSGTTNNGAVQILATNVPTKQGNIFKGWCTIDNSSDPTTCTGTGVEIIQPGNFLPLNTSSASITKDLYAVWKDNTPKIYMQDAALADCGQTMLDSRDGNEYTTALLADGNCWMTSNLKLGKGNGEIITLDSTDSDLPSGTTFDLKASGMGSSPDATGDCNVGDWYPSDTKQYLNVSHLCINTTTPSYGTYYNWYTAVAGTAGYNTTSGEAPGSICPAGWHLPPNAGNGSYYNLLFTKMGLSSDAASSTIMQQPPTSFLLSGYAYGEGLRNQGTYGYYWSSTANNNTYAYNLVFNSSRIGPQANGNKGDGRSVRCLLSS